MKTRDLIDFLLKAQPGEIEVQTVREAAHRMRKLEAALDEWLDKTEWMQHESFPAAYLGMHRADVMRDMIQKSHAPGKAYAGVMVWQGNAWMIRSFTRSEIVRSRYPMQLRQDAFEWANGRIQDLLDAPPAQQSNQTDPTPEDEQS